MGRRNYRYLTVSGRGGINQQERLAKPKNDELSDARNVWAPNGKLEKRPGYTGAPGLPSIGSDIGGLGGAKYALVEDYRNTPDVFTETSTLSSLDFNYRYYLGGAWDNLNTILRDNQWYVTGIYITMTSTNSNTTNPIRPFAEYWNGLNWVPLRLVESTTANFIKADYALSDTTVYLSGALPTDFADKAIVTDVATRTTSWIRFTIDRNGEFDASTVLNTFGYMYYEIADYIDSSLFRYVVKADFPTTSKVVRCLSNADVSNTTVFLNLDGFSHPASTNQIATFTNPVLSYSEPPTIAVVPQFGEFYVSYDSIVTVHKANVLASADAASLATVETSRDLVGPGEQYDPAIIPQLGTWPQAKYIAYHRGEMWAANLKDGGQTSVRWSAGSPNYKVWPLISIDVLADTDQGPITAIFPYNQNMHVFKSDSIWQMVYTGINDDKLNTYRAEKVIAGIGCVSQSSIQDINGTLVFLAEDGIYTFNGQVRKISDRIQTTIDSIPPGRRAFTQSVHWKSKSCYLLAVTSSQVEDQVSSNAAGTNYAYLPFKQNNMLIVWDYKNDSFWLWDNIEAVSLISNEDSSDVDHIYFIDGGGRMFELGVGYHDSGAAIEAYAITQRLGEDLPTHRLRLVEVNSTNLSESVSVEVQANDAPFVGTTDTSIDYTDSNENVYDTAVYDTATYVGERDRAHSIGVLKAGDSFKVKISHSEKNAPMVVNSISCGLVPLGVRK
jgi:hypothetical protein